MYSRMSLLVFSMLPFCPSDALLSSILVLRVPRAYQSKLLTLVLSKHVVRAYFVVYHLFPIFCILLIMFGIVLAVYLLYFLLTGLCYLYMIRM